VLILVMVGASALMLLPTPAHARTIRLEVSGLRWPVLAAMLVIGFYGGFIQVAVGILFIVLLYRVLRIDLVQVNALKVMVVLVYMIPALGIFVATGNVAWSYGLVLAVGSMTGAWLAVHVTLAGLAAILVQRFTLAVIAVIIDTLLFDPRDPESASRGMSDEGLCDQSLRWPRSLRGGHRPRPARRPRQGAHPGARVQREPARDQDPQRAGPLRPGGSRDPERRRCRDRGSGR
jgi:hypothetical protein